MPESERIPAEQAKTSLMERLAKKLARLNKEAEQLAATMRQKPTKQ